MIKSAVKLTAVDSCCRCVVLCDTSLAIVREGRCGKCANGQRNGTFPYCSPKDTVGLKPVCGSNNVTYRNAGAAVVARLQVVSQGACANKCGETVSQDSGALQVPVQ